MLSTSLAASRPVLVKTRHNLRKGRRRRRLSPVTSGPSEQPLIVNARILPYSWWKDETALPERLERKQSLVALVPAGSHREPSGQGGRMLQRRRAASGCQIEDDVVVGVQDRFSLLLAFRKPPPLASPPTTADSSSPLASILSMASVRPHPASSFPSRRRGVPSLPRSLPLRAAS